MHPSILPTMRPLWKAAWSAPSVPSVSVGSNSQAAPWARPDRYLAAHLAFSLPQDGLV